MAMVVEGSAPPVFSDKDVVDFQRPPREEAEQAQAEAAEPEPSLAAVEITYVDPDGGHVCRRDVFCDPLDWAHGHQSKFLISSDLVNLLSEAVIQKRERFDRRYEELATNRFGLQCALYRLRAGVDRISGQVLAEGELADAEDNGRGPSPKAARTSPKAATATAAPAPEVAVSSAAAERKKERQKRKKEQQKLDELQACPIHYYRPELYVDCWTNERLKVAIEEWKAFLMEDIKGLREQIKDLNEEASMGWYDTMVKMLHGGADAVQTGDKLLDEIEEEDERREIENKVSGGLRDKFDKLKPTVDTLEDDYADFTKRSEAIEAEVRQKDELISVTEERIREIQRRLKDPPPSSRVESESEPESEGRITPPSPPPEEDMTWFNDLVKAKIEALFAEWAKKLDAAKEKAAKAKEEAEDAEGVWRRLDKEEVKRIEQDIAGIEKTVRMLRKKCDDINSKAAKIKAKADKIMGQLNQEKQEQADLRSKLAELPPPGEATMRYMQMLREHKSLQAEDKKIRNAIIALMNKVKSIRYHLKELYKKLGWAWDLSDSEGDDDDKPYWERRKMAQGGNNLMFKFDPNAFVYEERTFKGRRQRNRAKQEQQRQAAAFLASMVANRHLHSEAVAKMHQQQKDRSLDLGLSEEAPGPGPFKIDSGDVKAVDPIEQAMESAFKKLSVSFEGSRSLTSPRTEQDNAKIQASCARLLRVHQLRSAALEELRTCARGLPELLPATGVLAGPRSQLVVLSAGLGAKRVEPELLDEGEEADQELEEMGASIQEVLNEAMQVSDKVSPISVTLEHSVRFAELRFQLMDLRVQRRLALAELRDGAGPDVLAGCSTRLPSLQASLLEPSTATLGSGYGSPRPLVNSPSMRSLLSGCPSPPRQPAPPSAPHLARHPPRLEAVVEPLLSPSGAASGSLAGGELASRGGQGMGRRRGVKPESTGLQGREVVDFGFRPDGVGEESLENWSLFKVSKAGASLGDGDVHKQARGLGSEKALQNDSKAAKLQQRLVGNCDFHDYVTQMKQNSSEMWHSSSTPDIQDWKKGPSLPQLVKKAEKAREAVRGDAASKRNGHGGKSKLSGSRSAAALLAW